MSDKVEPSDVEMKGETSLPPSTKHSPLIQNIERPSMNGTHSNEEDDDLSPPPDHIQSPDRIVDERVLHDEIVVNSNRNAPDKSSPLRVVSDHEDEIMSDAKRGSQEPNMPLASFGTASYPKRKRQPTLIEPNGDSPSRAPSTDAASRPKPYRRTAGGFPNVQLGYWRDSDVPDSDIVNKHAVIGFIDIRDRLRTRIQPTNRAGQEIDSKRYPIPPGPGGSWVTFERVVFEPHLVNLNHHQVKEFVKIRAGAEGETAEEKQQRNEAAVAEACRRIAANPPPDTAPTPAIAYGAHIPEEAVNRSDVIKRRKMGSGIGTIGGGPLIVPTQQPTPPAAIVQEPLQFHQAPPNEHGYKVDPVPIWDPLPGQRPTRIVIGYWKPSDAPAEADRHAVLGILSQNDMFRAKVVRETRDGRYIDGNFPSGAGALWIQWHEIVFEEHIRGLSRTEVKEYVRVRQYQIDRQGPERSKEERVNNETHAVYVAQQRVAHGVRPQVVLPHGSFHQEEDIEEPEFPEPTEVVKPAIVGQELRSNFARTELPSGRHSLPNMERTSSRTPIAARREFNSLSRQEIERLENQEHRRAHFAAQRDAINPVAPRNGSPLVPSVPVPNHVRPVASSSFQEQVNQLDGIWKMQEEQRNRSGGGEDAKFYGGIKYERKANGPWVGKLVSQGTLISIDGEDYVEYRVLAKPAF